MAELASEFVSRMQCSAQTGAAACLRFDRAGQADTSVVLRTAIVRVPCVTLRYSETDSGRTTYMFDENGNQQLELTPSAERTTTLWDYENQPKAVQLPAGGRITYLDNGDLRRVRVED